MASGTAAAAADYRDASSSSARKDEIADTYDKRGAMAVKTCGCNHQLNKFSRTKANSPNVKFVNESSIQFNHWKIYLNP